MRTVLVEAGEPSLTPEDVRGQCKLDDTAEDAYFASVLIPAVEGLFLQETRCPPSVAGFKDYGLVWPASGCIRLGLGMVSSVTRVAYSVDGGPEVDLPAADWLMRPADGGAMDVVIRNAPALELGGGWSVEYSAGFAELPGPARLWMLAHIAHFWRRREAATEESLSPLHYVDHLIASWRRVCI